MIDAKHISISKRRLYATTCLIAAALIFRIGKSLASEITYIVLLIISIIFISLDASKNLRELRDPKERVPKLFTDAKLPTGRIGFWILGIIFFLFSIFTINLRIWSSQSANTISAIIQLMLSFVFFFRASLKSFAPFREFVLQRYKIISVIIYYYFLISIIFLVLGIIYPIATGSFK